MATSLESSNHEESVTEQQQESATNVPPACVENPDDDASSMNDSPYHAAITDSDEKQGSNNVEPSQIAGNVTHDLSTEKLNILQGKNLIKSGVSAKIKSGDKQRPPISEGAQEGQSTGNMPQIVTRTSQVGAFAVSGRRFQHGGGVLSTAVDAGTDDTIVVDEPRDMTPNETSTPMAMALSKEDLERQVRQQILDEAVQATSVSNDHTSNGKKKYRFVLSMVGFLLIVVAAVIVGSVVARRRANDDIQNDFDSGGGTTESTTSPTESPTALPTLTREQEELLRFLQSKSSPNSTALMDQSSPQYRAFLWLTDLGDALFDFSPDTLTKYALATLYYATSGDNWVRRERWLEHPRYCEWQMDRQITFCDSSGTLRQITLTSNKLVGTLPPELGLLSDLSVLDVSSNQLNGTLPTEVFELRNMNTLILYGNVFSGTLPSLLGQFTRLTTLQLQNNQFEGSLPTEVGMLTNLREFQIEAAGFKGSKIPSEIGLMTMLESWGT